MNDNYSVLTYPRATMLHYRQCLYLGTDLDSDSEINVADARILRMFGKHRAERENADRLIRNKVVPELKRKHKVERIKAGGTEVDRQDPVLPDPNDNSKYFVSSSEPKTAVNTNKIAMNLCFPPAFSEQSAKSCLLSSTDLLSKQNEAPSSNHSRSSAYPGTWSVWGSSPFTEDGITPVPSNYNWLMSTLLREDEEEGRQNPENDNSQGSVLSHTHDPPFVCESHELPVKIPETKEVPESPKQPAKEKWTDYSRTTEEVPEKLPDFSRRGEPIDDSPWCKVERKPRKKRVETKPKAEPPSPNKFFPRATGITSEYLKVANKASAVAHTALPTRTQPKQAQTQVINAPTPSQAPTHNYFSPTPDHKTSGKLYSPSFGAPGPTGRSTWATVAAAGKDKPVRKTVNDDDVRKLAQMGFPPKRVRQALERCNGDLEEALNDLLP